MPSQKAKSPDFESQATTRPAQQYSPKEVRHFVSAYENGMPVEALTTDATWPDESELLDQRHAGKTILQFGSHLWISGLGPINQMWAFQQSTFLPNPSRPSKVKKKLWQKVVNSNIYWKKRNLLKIFGHVGRRIPFLFRTFRGNAPFGGLLPETPTNYSCTSLPRRWHKHLGLLANKNVDTKKIHGRQVSHAQNPSWHSIESWLFIWGSL